jgi:Taurine catabolism dioxygenase TauD, TfdA family
VYRSLTAQTLHYFARPHWDVRRTPMAGAAAWRGNELAERTKWCVALTRSQIDELERAIAFARGTGKPTGSLRRSDFPLPTLTREVDHWRRELTDGRGFAVLSGVPAERWGVADAELFFWCFGLHLGTPGAQNPQGDLLGHVQDLGDEVREVRAYRTNATIAYHCDAADVVGLLCLNRAKRGGLSRIASSVTVYNELLARRPDLIERLYEPFLLDTHGEGGINYFPIPPARHLNGRLRTFWHADYFRSALEYRDVRPYDRAGAELLETYDGIASEPGLYLDMDLMPGDVQLVSNHTILHSRTAYEDHVEPERRRHLLRLWLSLGGARSARERLLRAVGLADLVRQLARAGVRRLSHGASRRA